MLIWGDYYIFYIICDTAIEISAIHHQKENTQR